VFVESAAVHGHRLAGKQRLVTFAATGTGAQPGGRQAVDCQAGGTDQVKSILLHRLLLLIFLCLPAAFRKLRPGSGRRDAAWRGYRPNMVSVIVPVKGGVRDCG
jgi:hypothetical protein